MEATEAESNQTRAPEKLRVLIIDDDPVLKRVLSMGMRKRGYDVAMASNGEEAMTLVKTSAFDAILVDMMMPFMDGLRFLSWLRSEGIQTPVLVQTSVARQKIEAEAKAAGAQDVIIKPVRLPELLEKLQNVARR